LFQKSEKSRKTLEVGFEQNFARFWELFGNFFGNSHLLLNLKKDGEIK